MSVYRISLDGPWQFQIDPAGGWDVAAIRDWRTAQVPMPWQAQFDDLRTASGTAWYRRTVTVDAAALEALPERAAILHFGAADYFATVWLNGTRIGEHEGGYLPFEFDVAAHLRPGDNDLVVRVEDASDDRAAYPERPFSEVPHGKQSWYGPLGGLWQSVWLELRPRLHITRLHLSPDVAAESIRVQAVLSAPLPEGAALEAVAFGPDGAEGARGPLDAEGRGVLAVSAPHLWSPETPNLYSVEVAILGAPAHMLRDTCGFRTVEARDGRIYLNGKPVYLRGALDQGYFPETIYTPPSLEYLEDQARKAKALGLNCLRIHIKVEDTRYYEVADRLGLLVWTEIPNWALLTEAAARRGEETFRGMVERDGNHPSIIIWTLINENWGTDLARNSEHRRWLRDFWHWAKAIDPTRLIVDNSACNGNIHVTGDIEDYHPYRAIPDHAASWDAWTAEFASRQSDWIWHPDYQHERRPDIPLLVSEFGNWGLPDPATLHEQGREPWWFETGYERDEGIVYPHGMEHRYDHLNLDRVFGSFAEFIRTNQEHMALSLHYEITTMRLFPEVAGYVITELTDVHWECNGLLTMPRAVKHGLDPILTSVNQDRVLLLRPERWSGRPGDSISVRVLASDVDGTGLSGSIEWETAGARGVAQTLDGVIDVPLDAPGVVTLRARWLDDGAQVAANAVDLACVEPQVTGAPLLVAGAPELAQALHVLGYSVAAWEPSGAAMPQGAIVVADHWTEALEAHVQQGGRLLLLAADPSVLERPLPAGRIVARQGTPWQGDWATSFAWLRKPDGPFATLPGGPLLEMEYAGLMPDAVITGLPPWVMRDHTWAGLALGWLHRTTSLLTAMPYGRGQIAVTTFRLDAATLATDVMAQALFAGTLDLLRDKPQ